MPSIVHAAVPGARAAEGALDTARRSRIPDG